MTFALTGFALSRPVSPGPDPHRAAQLGTGTGSGDLEVLGGEAAAFEEPGDLAVLDGDVAVPEPVGADEFACGRCRLVYPLAAAARREGEVPAVCIDCA